MLAVDYVILGIVLVSVLLGFFRGFLSEAWSLLSWVIAIWAALKFSGLIEPYIGEAVSSPALQVWLGRIIVFATVLILGGLISGLFGLLWSRSGQGMSGTDRILGMGFGLGRGVVIIGLLAVVAEYLQFPKEPWWEESEVIPYAEKVSGLIKHFAGVGIEYLAEEELKQPVEEIPELPFEME